MDEQFEKWWSSLEGESIALILRNISKLSSEKRDDVIKKACSIVFRDGATAFMKKEDTCQKN